MTLVDWSITYLLHSTIAYGVVVGLRGVLGGRGTEAMWKAAMLMPFATASFAWWAAPVWMIDAPLTPSAVTGPDWDTTVVLVTVWLAVGLPLIGRDVAARHLFIHRIGHRRQVTGRLASALDDLRSRSGFQTSVRLTHSAHLASPVALGPSEICVPTRALTELDACEAEALLAHELAHLIRRDGFWFTGAACIESLLFVQPLHRVARRELQRLAEHACDRWAARQMDDPRAMAACLLEVAAWTRVSVPSGVPGIAGPRTLSERVRTLLAGETRPDSSLGGVVSVLALLGVMTLVPGVVISNPKSGLVAVPTANAVPTRSTSRSWPRAI
jgi:beta-lactamase regulating signal transducer with metallopeptidase domain